MQQIAVRLACRQQFQPGGRIADGTRHVDRIARPRARTKNSCARSTSPVICTLTTASPLVVSPPTSDNIVLARRVEQSVANRIKPVFVGP